MLAARRMMRQAAVFPTDYLFWWKPESLGLSDGTAVGSWTDSGPHSLTATQSSASNKPIYRASPTGFGGQPALQFTAANTQNLQLPYTSIVNPSAMTMVVVFRPNNITSTMGLVSSHEQSVGTSGYAFVQASSPSGTVRLDVRSTAAGGLSSIVAGRILAANTTHWAAATTTGSGTTGFGYLDGVQQTGGAVVSDLTVNTTDPFIIGHDPNFGSPHPFDGYIGWILAWDRVLASDERGAVDDTIKAFYGL